MIEDALGYPTNGEKGVERLLVGGVLMLFSILLFPLFLVYGYLVRCLAGVAAGEEEPPAFEDWSDLFVDGLLAFLISVAYAAVPVGLVVLLLVVVGVGGSVGGRQAAGLVAGVGVLGLLLFFAVLLLVAYVLMAALTNFAVEGEIGAAFEFGTIGRLAASESYLLAIVLAIVVQVVVGMVVMAAVVFTLGFAIFLLIPLGSFLNFWIYLVTVYLFGRAYRETFAEAAT